MTDFILNPKKLVNCFSLNDLLTFNLIPNQSYIVSTQDADTSFIIYYDGVSIFVYKEDKDGYPAFSHKIE